MVKHGNNLREAAMCCNLLQVIQKHWESMDEWKDGKPVEVRNGDGYIEVHYASGNYWHYDFNNGTWY